MKKILSIVMICILVLGFAGCGKDDSLESVTVVLDWTPNTNHAGLFLAKEAGYYENAGLRVNIIQPPEGGSEALVASGKAEFGISFQDSMAPALSAEKPLDIVAIAAICQHNLSGIISSGEKGIYSFKDMEGKSYATWGSPIEQAIIKYCMEEDGGDFGKLDFTETSVTDVFAALDTDMIDTVWVYEYWDVIKADIENYYYSYIDFKSVDEVMDYYTPVIITSGKYAEENKSVVERFLSATKRGYEECARDLEKATEAMLNADETLDEDLVIRSLEFLQYYYVDESGSWGNIDKDRWNGFYEWLYEKKLIDRDLKNIGFSMDYLRQ